MGELDVDVSPRLSTINMGVVIHWSGIRGFGILRSQSHGEVFLHAKSLGNCRELVVGDVVTFEMGFDRKKQKPEAINCLKAGIGGYKAPTSGTGSLDLDDRTCTLGTAAIAADPHSAAVGSTNGSCHSASAKVTDLVLADAAAAAALKLLSQESSHKRSYCHNSRSRSR